MKKLVFTFSLFAVCYSFNICFSQNLVPNPSFEIISSCPTSEGQINYATPWFSPTFYASIPMSDEFDTCEPQWPNGAIGVPLNGKGYQFPRTGNAYAGIYVFADYEQGREYISVKLISPIVAGKKYCIGFYVSLCNFGDTLFEPNLGSTYAIDRLGAYLSDSMINLNTKYIIPVLPQIENPKGHILSDTLNWMLVSGTYSSKTGGEQYITIGNFYENDSTNYLKVTNSHSHLSYYYIDDVYVLDCSDTLGIENYQNSTSINIFPNPASDYISVQFSNVTNDNCIFELYDALGNNVFSKEINTTENSVNISFDNVAKGVYICRILNADNLSIYNSKLVIIK